MNINHDKLLFEWGREGLSVKQDGREIAVVDCLELAKLHITYGDDLDQTPEGWFMSKKKRILTWLDDKMRGE